MSEQNEAPTPDQIGSALTDEQREKMKAFMAAAKAGQVETKTESGSEAVADATKGFTGDGKDVDWSEYKLPYELRHHYPQAKFRETPKGQKWVTMIDEFFSVTLDFGSYGKEWKNPQTGLPEKRNLGEFLSEYLNTGDGWRAVTILPTTGGQAGVLLQKQVPFILPDPEPLKQDTEVEAPSDPELERAENRALAFMENEGLSTKLAEEAAAQTTPLIQNALDMNPAEPAPHGKSVATTMAELGAALAGEDFGADQEQIDRYISTTDGDAVIAPEGTLYQDGDK